MSEAKFVNYTPDMVVEMVRAYEQEPTRETIESLAAQHGKTVRSVIAKLSAEGVYVKAERVTKAGAPVVRKEEIVNQICAALQLGANIPSMTKMTKTDLETLRKLVVGR